MRVGQKNKLTYRWARKGTRPRAIHDQRTQSTYVFGAVCPEHGTGAALVMPFCNTEAIQLHLNEIATKVTPGAHAILILDQAGWHGAKDLKVPGNISLLPLPPRSPELNPQENIWQFMRANWLSNRVFKSFDDIRQPLLLCLEHTHQPALENHVHRPPRLGTRRSFILRVGIRCLVRVAQSVRFASASSSNSRMFRRSVLNFSSKSG
jgi:DDE superfamily endonuclease